MENKLLQDLTALSDWIQSKPDELELAKLKSQRDNHWFTQEFMNLALDNICNQFLNGDKLRSWNANYWKKSSSKKRVGLIMAGNLPLVGFHDWLSVMNSQHFAKVKLSSKDKHLFPALLSFLNTLDPKWRDRTEIVDRLTDIDAIIATGSNNSNRYFSYYFGHLPHIFRSHRNAAAVITSDISDEELENLGEDVFAYFGLGCRSVSLCFIPEGFDEDRLFTAWTKFNHLREHSKWDNNFRYNYATYLMNNEPFRTNDVIILRDADQLSSRIACLHMKTYRNAEEVDDYVQQHIRQIQTLVGRSNIVGVPVVGFGKSQQPSLSDYADRVDTMEFLTKL